MRSGDLRQYLGQRNVEYVITNGFRVGEASRLCVPLWNADSVILDLGALVPTGKPVGRFALYRGDVSIIQKLHVEFVLRAKRSDSMESGSKQPPVTRNC